MVRGVKAVGVELELLICWSLAEIDSAVGLYREIVILENNYLVLCMNIGWSYKDWQVVTESLC